jgi:hypothetical protein
LLARAGGFDEAMRVSEDTDMIFRLALETDFVYVNEPLVCVDRTPRRADSLVAQYEGDSRLELSCKQHMYEKWLQLGDRLDSPALAAIRRRLRDVHNGWCDWHLSQGRPREAAQALARARRIQPGWKAALKSIGIRLLPGMTRRLVVNRVAARRQRQEELALGRD